MIEVISIIFQFLIFVCIFSFPLSPKILNTKFNHGIYNFGIFDTLMINAVIIFNFFLFLSFFNFNLETIFYSFFSIFIFFLIFNFKDWKNSLKNQKFLVIFFSVVCIVLFLNLAENLKFEWDGIAHWFFKTKSFYEGYKIENIQNLPASQYPHLGTYIWAFFWKNSLIEYEYLGRFVYIFFFVLSIFVASNLFVIKNNIFYSLIIILLIILTYDSYLIGGYQEYLLFSFGIILSKLILNSLNKNSSIFEKVIILLNGNLLMWFKDEGLFYFIILMGIYIFYQKEKFNRLVLLASVIFFIFLQYLSQQYLINVYALQEPIKNINFFEFFDVIFLFERLVLISKYFIISIIKYPIWLVILLSIFFIKKNYYEKKIIKFFIYKLIIFYSFLYLVYILHPQTSEFLLSVTLDRLLFQISGFFILPIIMFFHFFFSNKINKNNF